MRSSKGFTQRFVLSLILLCSFLLFSSRSWSCPNSPDDEMIIEYFNEIEFSEDIYITITDNGTQFTLILNCPPQQTPDFPPSNFNLQMYTSDNSQSASCNDGSIIINKIQLHSLSFCSDGEICSFLIILNNLITQSIYSQTELMITMTNGNNTYIPNLNPATLPLCPSNFNPCILEGNCPLSSDKEGDLSLCDSATATCSSPPNNQSYSYNENIYFQTDLNNTITSSP